MAIKLKIGSPVVGEDFFGREVELKKAESLIRDNNLMLAAPRRVGKTSFAKRLIDTLSSKGWNTIFIDLEEITSIDHFFNAFYGELVKLPETKAVEKVKAKMKKWLTGVEFSTTGLPVKATVKMESSDNNDFKDLADILNTLDNHTLVVFDELTVLLKSLSEKNDNEQAVRTFLNQFRAMRSATSEKCSWLICSSVEFVTILAESVGIEVNAKIKRYILDKIGWNIPFFIQLLLSRLPAGEITRAHVDEAYGHLLQTGSFDTWHERLNIEYGSNKDVAKLILKYLCVNVDGKIRDEIYNHIYARIPSFENDELGLLLRALMTDGYLVRDGEQYKFRSPLLRDYWKETYC